MMTAKYPLQLLGPDGKLNDTGMNLYLILVQDGFNRFSTGYIEAERVWKTFRDADPSPFKSVFTGTTSVPLQGRWLEIGDDGILSSDRTVMNIENLDQALFVDVIPAAVDAKSSFSWTG